MNEEKVFEVMKQKIIEILPELADRAITVNDSLREIGANSVDRAEILIETMAALKVKVPLVSFGKAKNISEIISIFVNNAAGT